MTPFSDIGRTAAYDQQKAGIKNLLRETVWVYQEALKDEGSEMHAMDYMATNFAKSASVAADGDYEHVVLHLTTLLCFSVQMLSDEIGEIE